MSVDPHHPLFEGLGRAEVRSFRFERGAGSRDAAIELVLRSGVTDRTFRFSGVSDLRLGGGFPEIGWLQVHDIIGRQLDGLGIHVSDGEQSDAIEFWASGVEEVF